MKYGEGLDYTMLSLDSENFKEFFDPAGLAACQASVHAGLMTAKSAATLLFLSGPTLLCPSSPVAIFIPACISLL